LERLRAVAMVEGKAGSGKSSPARKEH
jgi:hypothetical protein